MLCHKTEVFASMMHTLQSAGTMVDGHSQKQQRGWPFLQELPRENEFSYGELTGLGVAKAEDESKRSKTNGNFSCYHCQLEEDVQKLQKQLQEELDLRVILESAIHEKAGTLPNLPCHLPIDVQELLASVALLEITIAKLEEETVSLHYQLSQERNERRLLEYSFKQLPSLSQPVAFSSSDKLKDQAFSSLYLQAEDCLEHSLIDRSPSLGCSSSGKFLLQPAPNHDSFLGSMSSKRNSSAREKMGASRRARSFQNNLTHKFSVQHAKQETFSERKFMKDLWQNPNQLSQEMVRCMEDIFIHLADPVMVSSKFSPAARTYSPRSPLGHITASLSSFSESSSFFSFARSPPVDFRVMEEVLGTESTFDPYSTRGKLRWADIGKYSSAMEVSWMSVGKEQLEYAAEALRKFRLLVEQLAKVNPGCMNHEEKLAFWINIYNALMMHAYLAYGVPRSELKLFALMQKAAYTVGGHSFNAATIEYVILRMKPPIHRPQMALLLALHKLKISEEQSQYVIDHFEPLVTFALSCGVHSSPAVRIFTAEKIHEGLQYALHDYICASVGISGKGKLLVPKLLHCFAKGVIEENELVDWICQFLSPSQAVVVQNCITQRRQRFLGSRSYAITPFDLRFRYLFLPENRN